VGLVVSNSSELPRPEWIYRRPKTPIHARSHCTSSSPISSHFKGRTIASSSLPHSHFTARTGRSFDRLPSSDNTISYAVDPFSPTIFHSRSHSEQSFSPSLKRLKSHSETGHKSTPSSPSRPKISSPKLISVRPPSISSSSTSTSRSSSPRTPATPSSSIYTKTRRPLPYRRHPENDSTLPPLSSSCPPSKSILTRTSSISTKESSFTGNKSVKFAAVPVVHYATASYWDLDNFDKEETTMGINIDAMDVDDSYHEYRTHVPAPKDSSGMLDIAKLRELQCATPTPERENAKTKGLKRLLSLTKKPLTTTTTSTSVATVYRSQLSPRPVISIPYPLGTHPTSALQSDASLPYSATGATDSAPDLVGILRSAQSLESFRSSKSSATRSVYSMGSFKSSLSTRGLRAWLRRTTRWTWGGQPPER
jgi:hypothetical protein